MSVLSDKKVAFFTICSNNYMAYARTLLDSARLHHPEAQFHIFLVDEKIDVDDFYPDGCRLKLAKELGIPDFASFAFQYDALELNTAVKPFAFIELFEQGYDRVVYFDADIELFRSISSVFDALDLGASFVLTPHLYSPSEGEGYPDDLGILRAGVYNLGFLACSRQRETERILHWWARQLRFRCVNDQDAGIFVDQRFMDLVPGFAESCHILRDKTVNTAYFNLGQRDLTWDGATWFIEGQPLTFFHFTGFQPSIADQLSKHTGNYRGSAITPALQALIEHYRQALIAHGHNKTPSGLYAYGRFASGTPIPVHVRQMYRERHRPWGSDPFVSYEEFIHLPHVDTPRNSGSFIISNLMRYMWDRFHDLQRSFDLSRPDQAEAYVRWYVAQAASRFQFDPRLIEPAAARSGRWLPACTTCVNSAKPGRPDVTVVGYFKMVGGVGEVGRQTLQAFRSTDLVVDGHDVALGLADNRLDDNSCSDALSPTIEGRIQIYNVNADQLALVMDHVRPRVRDEAYRIAIPFWELEEFPDAWLAAFDNVDEIWAPSRFIQVSLFRKLKKPIVHMPVALEFDLPPGFDRAYFGLPERKFLFFFAFDFMSFQERKNPKAAYRAFRRAFPANGIANVGLVVKSLNGMQVDGEHTALRDELANDPDVTFLDTSLTRPEMLGLINECDCVISLHRSEGLGLLVAEAMAMGKPVIATDYSATTELVTPETGFAVDYRLIPVEKGQYPFAAGQWAEPDELHAAWLMRHVHADYAAALRRADHARRHIENGHSRKRIAALQRERLRALSVL